MRTASIDTPSVLARSRSIFSCACRPRNCESLVTSRNSGSARSLSCSLQRPVVELVGLHALQDVLVLRLARPAAELQVLDRLHVDADARHLAQLAAQALDDLLHRLALGARLQVDEHAAGVLRAPPPPLNELTVATFGSARTIAAARSCSAHHRRERDVLGGLGADP